MARLLDLPDEIILLIVENLQAGIQGIALSFYELGDAHRHVISHNPSRKVKDLHSLLLTSRRFRGLLTPAFYRDVFARHHCCAGEKRPLDQLKWTLEKNPSLSEDVLSAFIPCGSSGSDSSIREVVPFFWFANIRTLTIHGFTDLEPLEFENDSHVGTSPVECLRLIDCGAHEKALAAVLSWPAALKILHYDAGQGEWAGRYGDEPAKEWTAAAFVIPFVRTLQSQKKTLEELTMTRPWLVHEGLDNGPRIDLSEFEALRTLRIYHDFLCGDYDPYGAWKVLPPNLEVLEVFYDSTNDTCTRSETDYEPYDTSLLDLIEHKRTHLPHLHTVTIYSLEHVNGPQSGQDLSAGHWTLASPMASEAEAAGIKLNVWLGFPGDPNFEETDVFESLKINQTDLSGRSHRSETAVRQLDRLTCHEVYSHGNLQPRPRPTTLHPATVFNWEYRITNEVRLSE